MNTALSPQCFTSTLERQGWLPTSPKEQSLTGLLATREFDTAVGPKTAHFYLQYSGDGQFIFQGNYMSEGRNVLSAISGYCLESNSPAELDERLIAMLESIKVAIDQSYARRLLIRTVDNE